MTTIEQKEAFHTILSSISLFDGANDSFSFSILISYLHSICQLMTSLLDCGEKEFVENELSLYTGDANPYKLLTLYKGLTHQHIVELINGTTINLAIIPMRELTTSLTALTSSFSTTKEDDSLHVLSTIEKHQSVYINAIKSEIAYRKAHHICF